MSTDGAGGGAQASARLVSALATDHPARQGWIRGTVIDIPGAGLLRIRTATGSVLVEARHLVAEPGAQVSLRLQGSEALVQTPDRAAAVPPSRPLAPPVPAPALSGAAGMAAFLVPAVERAAAPDATQLLAGLAPAAGSPAFTLIAALFPYTLLDGSLQRRVSSRPTDAGYGQDRLDSLARQKVSAGEAGNPLSWTLPFQIEDTLRDSRWSLDREAEEPERAHMVLEADFAFVGRVRIDALRDGSRVAIHLASEKALPVRLAAELETLVKGIGESAGLRVSFAADS